MRNVAILALLFATTAGAEEPATAELVSDPFLESYQPEVSVSGNVIVGVMTSAASAAIAADRIAVAAAGEAGGTVCLRAASRDGIYTSRNVYALPATAAGDVRLPYRSRLADVVGGYADDEIALAATAGDCDSGSADYYLLSSTDDDAPSDVVIYLNSFGATDVFFAIGDGDVEPCDYISEGRRTTFDFICRLGDVDTGAGLPVTIIRERFGREQPPVELRIVGNAG